MSVVRPVLNQFKLHLQLVVLSLFQQSFVEALFLFLLFQLSGNDSSQVQRYMLLIRGKMMQIIEK